MRFSKHPSAGNGLLAALTRKDRQHFIAGSKEVDLVPSEVLCNPGERISHVYFPTSGYVSLLAAIDGSLSVIEAGLVGAEGVINTAVSIGVTTSTVRALVQGAGSALRMTAPSFRRELAESPAFRDLLGRYLWVRLTQFSNALACNRFHEVEPRLARRLLMTRDRARSDAFYVTHEILSQALGVRREGVSKAAASLQAQGHIRYSRGNVEILDGSGLMGASCSCYRADLKTYDSILG